MYIIHSWAGIGVLIPFAALFLVGFIVWAGVQKENHAQSLNCLLYTSPSPRDRSLSRMPSSA